MRDLPASVRLVLVIALILGAIRAGSTAIDAIAAQAEHRYQAVEDRLR